MHAEMYLCHKAKIIISMSELKLTTRLYVVQIGFWDDIKDVSRDINLE